MNTPSWWRGWSGDWRGRGQGSDWNTVPSDCAPTNQNPRVRDSHHPPQEAGSRRAWLSTLYLPPEPLGIRPCLKPCIAPLSPCVCGSGNREEVSEGLEALGLCSQYSLQRKAPALSLCSSVSVVHPTPTRYFSVLPCVIPRLLGPSWVVVYAPVLPACALCPCLWDLDFTLRGAGN